MDDRADALDPTDLLLEQLEWHWDHVARPRLEGLGDDELLWEPVPGWSVRPRGEATSPTPVGGGDHLLDWAWPPPEPAPVTTIAWRLAHLVVHVLGPRTALHFGGPPVEHEDFVYAATADEVLAQLDEQHAAWVAGVRTLGADGLASLEHAEHDGFPGKPMATVVLHVNRECLHHLAEVALLRDLWAHGVR